MKLFQKQDTTNGFGDITHSDGSKTYNTSYGMIKIERPSVVRFIENILQGGHMGWSYAPIVEKGLEDNVITKEEMKKIYTILD